jgi:hypothetical protein
MARGSQPRDAKRSEEKPGRLQILLVVVAVLLLAAAVGLLVSTPSVDFHPRGR